MSSFADFIICWARTDSAAFTVTPDRLRTLRRPTSPMTPLDTSVLDGAERLPCEAVDFDMR
jgi:hypothetical protein